MQATHLRAILPGVTLAVAIGCSAADLVAPGTHDDSALIIFYGDTSHIVAPDTVVRGAAFEVSFTTYGGGCTRSVARTDLTISGAVAEIRPYDTTVGGSTCTADLLFLRHVARVQAATAGTFTIRVIGQQRGASTGSVNGPAEISRVITAR